MTGGVPELACRKRLRSYDTKVKNKEEEDKKKKKMHNDDEEEDMTMWNSSDNKVKNRKVSSAILEKEKRRKILINLSDDDDDEEEIEMWDGKVEKRMRSGDDKVGNRKASTATFEKEKKKKTVSSHGGEKKMQSGDRDKDKKMSVSLPLKQNNYFLKEKNKKMVSSEKKMRSVDHDKDNRRNMLVPLNKSKCYEKEKKKMLSSHNAEKKMWCDHDKDKRSVPLPFDKNKMQKNEMKKSTSPIACAGKKKMRPSDCMETKMQNGDSKAKKKNTPPILSQENKIPKLSNKMENKRKEGPMLFKKKKKMRADNKEIKEVGSDDGGKEKIQGDKEQNMHSSGKEKKRSAPLAFFKVICKNFKEFLLIPPTIASKFADLTNHHVYLEDSEGKSSKIRLSVVDGSLAFHQGWDNFVLDHSIKYGDFLLFEYTAMSKFSVRVFGVDSCERLCFNVERKGGKKKQKESHALDDRDRNSEDINDRHYVSDGYLGSKGPKTKADGYMNSCEIAPGNLVAKSMNAASGTCCITATTKEDPNGVVRGVECGPSIALDNKDAYLVNGEHKAKNISQKCSKEETRESEIIIITNEDPLTQENEDTAKLTPLNAASETRYVTANTKEDPKEVASGAWCGPSMALDNNEGTLAIGDCKTMSIYATCCKEKARKSEIILITDAAPLAQENGDAAKLPIFSHHIEDTSMKKESEPEVASPTKCMEIQDSDQDLRRKQEGNTILLKCAKVVDKCPNNSKMKTNGNVCRKYEAPGGSQCLEKWKKDTVSSVATPVGIGITKPENSQKTDEFFFGNCGATGFNPFEQWLLGSNGTDSCVQPMLDKISKSGHFRTEINHSVNGKGSTVQLQTKKEQLEPVQSRQRNNICANHAVARQSEYHIVQQEIGKSSNHVTPVALLPVKVEVLELDDHAVLKTSLQFCIPSTTQTWLELPNSLSNAVRRKGRQDRNVIMLKDPMKRLWPVFYHENSIFVGFTRGWKPFVAANNLQIGDLCMLFKDLDEDEAVYHVQIKTKQNEDQCWPAGCSISEASRRDMFLS